MHNTRSTHGVILKVFTCNCRALCWHMTWAGARTTIGGHLPLELSLNVPVLPSYVFAHACRALCWCVAWAASWSSRRWPSAKPSKRPL
jgi:hypothetical protein